MGRLSEVHVINTPSCHRCKGRVASWMELGGYNQGTVSALLDFLPLTSCLYQSLTFVKMANVARKFGGACLFIFTSFSLQLSKTGNQS